MELEYIADLNPAAERLESSSLSAPTLSTSLSVLYGYPVKVYGPYTAKDNRRRVVLISQGKSTTHQLARVLLELKLQRRLTALETVDHVDDDFSNDALDNLQVLSLADNVSKSARRAKRVDVICVWCETQFSAVAKTVNRGRKLGMAGPFCSRQCVGSYGKSLQGGGPPLPSADEQARVYYKNGA